MQTQKKRLIIKKTTQQGFSLIEVLVAASILATVVTGSMAVQTSLMGSVRDSNENAFASEKALQMFEELRSYTEGSQESLDTSLSKYSDGASYSPNLSTALKIVSPDDPLSGNQRHESQWKYVRQVAIEPLENDEFAKKVRVSVWRSGSNGQPLTNRPLATVAGVLKTSVPRTPPTQLYDFYVIAIANTPSWWSDLYDFKPSYDSVFNDLEFRNPGLKLRKRFISNFGFGRDPFYLPHTNTEKTTEDTTVRLPWTYYYPGQVEVQNGGNVGKIKEDYAFDYISARIRGDVSEKIFHISEKPTISQYRPYALADEFNHVLRLPDQRAMEGRLFQYANSISTASTIANPGLKNLKESLLQPSLLTFLEDMNQGKYRNSMVSNMHAELTPIVPYRNYADAAKVPSDERGANATEKAKFQNERVVTHPEKIFYANSDDVVRFRVYPYEAPEFNRSLDQNASGSTYSATDILTKKIEHLSVFLPMDGSGVNGENPLLDGFLNNPVHTPTLSQAQTIAPVKIIGNSLSQYRYRRHASLYGTAQNDTTCMYCSPQSVTDARRDYTLLTTRDIVLRGTNSIPPNDASLPGGISSANQDVQTLGRLFAMSADRRTLIFNNTQAVNSAADKTALIGDMLIVNAEQVYNSSAAGGFDSSLVPTNREIRQVINVQQPATLNSLGLSLTGLTTLQQASVLTPVVITLDRPLNENHATNRSLISLPFLSGPPTDGELVSRHKDYSIDVNPTVYGQQRNGININLYNTPTRHPSGPSNTGLTPARRLFGLEYIPAPVNEGAATTPNDIVDDFKTDLTDVRANTIVFPSPQRTEADSNANLRAKNTARWIIQADTNSISSTALEKTTANTFHITAETRIVGGQAPDSSSYAIESPILQNYLEDGLYGDGNPYKPNQGAGENNQLRPNPYNVSRTYVYRGLTFEADVPRFEQVQYIGDPRHMPYADVKARDGYNTAFFCMTTGTNCNSNQSGFSNEYNTRMGGYDGYDAHTGQYSNVSKIDIDVSKAFSMYIDGIMKSNSVYNTIAGYTNYIVSLGGGIGQRGNHTYLYNIKQAPWSQSSASANTIVSNSEGTTVLSERGSGGSLRFVTATTGGANAWSGFNHLGEMFPDEMYTFWLDNGNLPNTTYSQSTDVNPDIASPATLPSTINGASPHFYRAPYYDTKYDLGRRERITAEGAVSDFYNGSSDPGNTDNKIKHSTSGGSGCLQAGSQAAGRYLSDAFNMSLPESISSTRSFCASSGTCYNPNGTNSSAYTNAENMQRRNTIKYVNLTGPNKGLLTNDTSEYNTFYQFNTGSCGSGAKVNAASAMIRISREAVGVTTAKPDMVGYAVINGLDQGSTFGAQTLSRLAQSATLQAYLEGGDKGGKTGSDTPGDDAGRIVPLPRVELLQPNPNLIYSQSSVNVQFKVDWLRWDEKAYSPSYPTGWFDTIPIRFNAMYSPDNGVTWRYVNTNNVVPEGQLNTYNPSEPVLATNTVAMSSSSQTWNFAWNISALADASYPLRIYTYREGFDIGASYHEILLTRKTS